MSRRDLIAVRWLRAEREPAPGRQEDAYGLRGARGEPAWGELRPAAALALPLLGLCAWGYGIAGLSPAAIGAAGLLAGGSPWLVVGVLSVLCGWLLELGGHGRAWVLALATVPIVFGAPEYAWVYKHVGIASAFEHYGRVTDPASIYQQWPALFTAVGSLGALAHVSPLSLAKWAPLAFELADALVLTAVFRLLVGDRRVVSLALLLYVALVSWVGQDYLSPQAFGYLLWLGIVLIVLRWLRAPAPAGAADGRSTRLRKPLLVGLEPPPETTSAMRTIAVVLVAAIYFAIVAAHQLTPYIALAGVGALTILDLVRPRWLLVAMAAIAGSYLAVHYDLIAQQFGGLFSGANPLANASGARGTSDASSAAIATARVVDGLTGSIWLATAASVVQRRRRLGQVVIPAALAFSPFAILLAQSYGGEAIYRVYLFSAPWCALLIAVTLWELRSRLRPALMVTVSTAVLFAGLEGLYGPAAVNGFTRPELHASLWLYEHLPSGSLIVLPVGDFPALEMADYNDYDLEVLPADPQLGPAWMDEGDVRQVRSWVAGLGYRTAYVVVSRSMNAWASFYGEPRGYPKLVGELSTTMHATVVYRNQSTTIYRIGV